MTAVKGLVYLVDKTDGSIRFAGEVPAVYGQITGLSDIDYSELKDLDKFGEQYKNLGFFTETDAISVGAKPDNIALYKAGAWELIWNGLEATREDLIESQRWRVNRNDDEVKMGDVPTEDIRPVLQYIKDIRNLPTMYPDPFTIVWPAIPPLPAKNKEAVVNRPAPTA